MQKAPSHYSGDLNKSMAPWSEVLFFTLDQKAKLKRKLEKAFGLSKKGLQTLTNAIESKLGNKIHLNTQLESFNKKDGKFYLTTNKGEIICEQLVLACPPSSSSKILKPLIPEASRILSEIPLAPIAVVHLSTDEVEKIPSGFGMLIPRSENIETLGVLFSSKTFTNRAPKGKELLTVFIGGTMNPDLIEKSEDEITSIVIRDLHSLLSLKNESLTVEKVTKWKACIPQLVLDHDKKIAKLLEETNSLEGLHLCGNYLTGVGIKDAVASAQKIAAKF